MLPLERACSTEGPAGATPPLVLHLSHDSLAPPVNRLLWYIVYWGDPLLRQAIIPSCRGKVAIVKLNKFCSLEISKFIHRKPEAKYISMGIMHFHEFLSGLPDDTAMEFLQIRAVLFAIILEVCMHAESGSSETDRINRACALCTLGH